jgi:hypothetical protein
MKSIDLVFHLPRMCHCPEAHGRLGWGGRAQFDFFLLVKTGEFSDGDGGGGLNRRRDVLLLKI